MSKYSVVDQAVWDAGYEKFIFHESADPIMNNFIHSYLPSGSGAALEIGCFPGRFLPAVARKGYEIFGIDKTTRLPELPLWLESLGLRTGDFFGEDFISWESQKCYDAVLSFGFVEHFINWRDIFIKHCDLVAPGGTLMVSFPHFRGKVQHLLHNWLDRPNLLCHHLPAMQIEEYRKICLERGFSIVFSGYFGGFDFWVNNATILSDFQKISLRIIMKVKKLFRGLPSLQSYAPYAGIVAQRTA